MKNQAFARQNQLDHDKKLHVVLRRLTEDRLTAEQRSSIERAVVHRRQYYLQMYGSLHEFDRAVSGNPYHNGRTRCKTLFGSAADPPMAKLVWRIGFRGPESTIYIYLPDIKEEG